MIIDDVSVKVKIITRSSQLLAQAEVNFGVVETKGWRISKSREVHPRFQEQVWIQPPSYPVAGKYHNTVYIGDKDLFRQVEDKIYDSYVRAKSNTPPETEELPRDEVRVEDIPL